MSHCIWLLLLLLNLQDEDDEPVWRQVLLCCVEHSCLSLHSDFAVAQKAAALLAE